MPLPAEEGTDLETGSTGSSINDFASLEEKMMEQGRSRDLTPVEHTETSRDVTPVDHAVMSRDVTPVDHAVTSSDVTSVDHAVTSRDVTPASCESSETSMNEISTRSFYGSVTEEMEKEEERLKMETENAEEMERVQELAKLKQAQRFNRLQHLLEKSSIYSKLLGSKMEMQMEANKKMEIKTRKRKRGESEEGKGGNKGRVLRSKRRKENDDKYDLSEYIDESGKLKRSIEKPAAVKEPAIKDASTLDMSLSQDEELKELTTVDGQVIPAGQPSTVTGGILRPYQIDGVNWLKVLYENGINGILADEMGLGKTIQCIGFIAHLIEMGVKGPFLVAAPLSTVSNWVAEFKKFTPTIPVYLYHGTIEDRHKLRKKMFPRHKPPNTTLPVVVTSYEICLKDRVQLANRSWKFLIVDEGHRIKNLNCKLVKVLKLYDSANRLLLTGTPLQNNLSELWSLLNFLIPDVFDDLNSFQCWFDFSSVIDGSDSSANEEIIAREKQDHVLSTLHQILTPFLLRRLKSDVELNLPPKKEVLVYAPLSSVQEMLYTKILNNTIQSYIDEKRGINNGSDGLFNCDILPDDCKRSSKYRNKVPSISDDQFEAVLSGEIDYTSLVPSIKDEYVQCVIQSKSVMSVKMQCVWVMLRKCCNHPYLVEFPLDDKGDLKIDDNIITTSGKMMMLDKMLPLLLVRGHKVLIFSQMTQLMDILADYMDMKSIHFARLDGTMSCSDREDEMKRFREDSTCNVFLLSTRAGGLGINLTAADTVIIFDSDWNPQCDLQAQDRCHRIGQTRPVIVYRFVTANTIDQRIVERACGKRKLEKMVIHKGKFKGNQASTDTLSINDLAELLRSVDHDKVVKSNEIISDEALEALMERNFTGPTHSTHEEIFKIIETQSTSPSTDVTCNGDHNNDENIMNLSNDASAAIATTS
jgi:ATP-dependent DNA helicase